jgi:hypothetical protein
LRTGVYERQHWQGNLMVDAQIITKFIAVHAKWKHHLKTAIETGRSEYSVSSTAKGDQCEFGRWLQSLPRADQSTDEWQKVHKLHNDFHKTAADVLALAVAGKKEEASAEMAIGGKFAQVSANLTVAMSAWKKSL